MIRTLRRLRALAAALVAPRSPSFVDALFDGGYVDPPTTDLGSPVRAGTRVDRVRWRRADLSAALRADPGSPERELAAWPPVSSSGRGCRAC